MRLNLRTRVRSLQDQPNDLGDAMRHGPSGPFAIHAWLQPCKQAGEERVFCVDGGPGNLTKQPPQIPVALAERWL
jgi:hypothetical protein